MARNKYPEETIRRIVEVSTRLFMEQGYDNTSIQDIINNLGGLSKGAIYHHFHSKEEILDAVTDYIYHNSQLAVEDVMADKGLNGLQKLRRMIEVTIGDAAQEQMLRLRLDMRKNPQILAMQLWGSQFLTKLVVLPVVQEGIADGSLGKLAYPLEFSEAFMLLINIWLNPLIFLPTPEEEERRCYVIRAMVRGMGVEGELLSDYTVQRMKHYVVLLQDAREQKE